MEPSSGPNESNRQYIIQFDPSVLETNLSLLSTNYPHLSNILKTVYQQNSIILDKTRNHYKLFDESKLNQCFLNSENFEQEQNRVTRSISSLQPQPQSQLFFILGLDMGYTLQKLLPFVSQSPLTALIIVEPDERIAASTFAYCDLSTFIKSNRISFVIGKNFDNQLDILFDEKNYFATNKIKVFPSSTANQSHYTQHWNALRDIIGKLRTKYQQIFKDEVDETRSYYRQNRTSPIKSILSLFHTEGLAVRYIQQRFLDECKNQGKNVIDYHPGFANEIGIMRTLFKHKPDCLFFMNRSPGEYVDIDLLNSIKIPRMLWCVDDPNSFIKDPYHHHDIVFSWDKSYSQDMLNNGAKHVEHFPYVADLDHTDPKIREEFFSNVSYIGQVKVFDPSELGLDDNTSELVKKVGEEKANQPEKSYQSLIIKHQKKYNLNVINDETETVPRFIRYGIYTVANAIRRIQVLETVMPYGLKFYGGDDWLKVLGEHPLTKCFQGIADPEKDVPDIFVSSKINLNIHSLQALTSLNQRDFNCPLVGGFLLTDWVKDANQFFKPDEELIFYKSVEDLKTKIEYYLSNEDERKAITAKGSERVLRDHTYASRVPKVLEKLNHRISEQLYP